MGPAQPTYSAPCCALELLLFEMGALFGGHPQSQDNAFAPYVTSGCKVSSLHSKSLTSLAAMRGPRTIAEPAMHLRPELTGGVDTAPFSRSRALLTSEAEAAFSQMMSQAAAWRHYLL